jgi:hypothetical protein
MEIKRIKDNKKFTSYLIVAVISNILVGAIVGINYALILPELIYNISLIFMSIFMLLGISSIVIATSEANIEGKLTKYILISSILLIVIGMIMILLSINIYTAYEELRHYFRMEIIVSVWLIGLGVALLMIGLKELFNDLERFFD